MHSASKFVEFRRPDLGIKSFRPQVSTPKLLAGFGKKFVTECCI